KSTAATKMLASRARRKVQTIERPTGVGREQRKVVQAFLAAARRGDFEELLRILDPEVKLTVDTPSGVVVTLGATQVAAGAQLSASAATQGRTVPVNGLPAIISWREDGTPLPVLAFTVVDGRITDITVVIDPAKLALMDLPPRRPAPARAASSRNRTCGKPLGSWSLVAAIQAPYSLGV
ncbi:hypothetical protein ABZY09_14600, partial [Streptomyces sp. NPDC002928]